MLERAVYRRAAGWEQPLGKPPACLPTAPGSSRLAPWAISQKPGAGAGGSGGALAGVQLPGVQGRGAAWGRHSHSAHAHTSLHGGPRPAASLQSRLRRADMQDGVRGKGTDMGWLISLTLSRSAGLGRTARGSPAHPCTGAETRTRPYRGLQAGQGCCAVTPQLPHCFCRSQIKAAETWGSHGCPCTCCFPTGCKHTLNTCWWPATGQQGVAGVRNQGKALEHRGGS